MLVMVRLWNDMSGGRNAMLATHVRKCYFFPEGVRGGLGFLIARHP